MTHDAHLRFRVLGYIAKYQREHGYSPTFREIADALDRSVSAIHHHIHMAVELGEITHQTGQSRTLILTPTGRAVALDSGSR